MRDTMENEEVLRKMKERFERRTEYLRLINQKEPMTQEQLDRLHKLSLEFRGKEDDASV